MTAEERRVIEALQAHTGGLIVTEQDTHNAQRQLQEKLEITSTKPPRGPFLLAAAAVIVLIAGVVGFVAVGGNDEESTAPSGQRQDDPYADFLNGIDPTNALLQGVWRAGDDSPLHPLLVRFSSPNLVAFDAEGSLFHNPAAVGTYAIDGDGISISLDGGRKGCAGLTTTLRLSLVSANTAHAVTMSPGDGDCTTTEGTRWELEQLLPINAGTPDEIPVKSDKYFPADGWHSLENKAALRGDWLAVSDGYLLEVDEDGSYVVAGDSGQPVDQGEWTASGDELSLTSGAGSTTCAAGDRLVLGSVEQLVIPHDAGIADDTVYTRSTVQRDSCNRAWAGATWFLYSVPVVD